MRRLLPLRLAASLVGLMISSPSMADEVAAQVRLTLSAEETRLVVQTLSAIDCGNVQRLMVCNEAVVLLQKIRDQAKEQVR